MTKEQAIESMKEGKRVTHLSFTSEEWMSSDKHGDVYTFEDGVKCARSEFWEWRTAEGWNTDWEIFN